MTELTNRCLALNRHRRKILIKVLQHSLEEEQHDNEERFKVLYDIATSIFGNGILTSSREFNHVLGRRFIACQMRAEGFSFPVIGKYLKRHHSSVIHMQYMMDDVFRYPDMFKLEMGYWHIFQARLKEYEVNR